MLELLPDESNDPDENGDLKRIGLHETQTDIAADKRIAPSGIGAAFIDQTVSQVEILVDILDILDVRRVVIGRESLGGLQM